MILSILVIGFICVMSLTFDCSPQKDEEFCTICTKSGEIRGKINQTLFDQKLYYSFRGIPYAKPPIDELRFKVNKR